MVSGARPLKAKKLRYFEDQNFTTRILPAPAHPVLPERRSHDWAGVLASAEPVPPTVNPTGSDEGGLQHSQTPSLDPSEKEAPARDEVHDAPHEDGDIDDLVVKTLKPAQRELGIDRDFFPKY